jgi:hypothetical protein
MAMSNSVKADGGKPSEWLAKLSKLLKKAFGKYSFVFACTAT